ncbi:DUF5677 domain-containing protein [Chromobacterium violaceum]|uniref:DUF5677 domain-containing protein n=1 Tax=Chromobacterium violaceum TaxID=536 RepID=UPI00143CD33F|nr:DUF5677 domain-containing protein [Chromobacterium violaceum]QIY79537.1 hypothetical protein FOB43_10200 [Chromobacterium violaceum]
MPEENRFPSLEDVNKLHENHVKHINILKTTLEKLRIISQKICIETHPKFSPKIKRIQLRYFLKTIEEMNEVAYHACLMKRHTAVEAISRISVEMSVNFIYIAQGEKHSRAKGLLKYYIEKGKKSAKKWEEFLIRNKNESSLGASRDRYKTMLLREQLLGDLTQSPYEAWPNSSLEKFKKIGFEGGYNNIFSPASDSVHLLGEDIINIFIGTFLHDKNADEYFDGIIKEKQSYAIYLLICSAVLQWEALSYASEIIADPILENELEDVRSELIPIYEQHELDSKWARETSIIKD